jgi:hypothetical protein
MNGRQTAINKGSNISFQLALQTSSQPLSEQAFSTNWSSGEGKQIYGRLFLVCGVTFSTLLLLR